MKKYFSDLSRYCGLTLYNKTYLDNVELPGLCFRSERNLFNYEFVGMNDILLWYIWDVKLCDRLFLAECDTWKVKKRGKGGFKLYASFFCRLEEHPRAPET